MGFLLPKRLSRNSETADIAAPKTTDEEKSRSEIQATHQLLLFMNLIWRKTAPGNDNNVNQHQLLSGFITEIDNFSSSSFLIIKSGSVGNPCAVPDPALARLHICVCHHRPVGGQQTFMNCWLMLTCIRTLLMTLQLTSKQENPTTTQKWEKMLVVLWP